MPLIFPMLFSDFPTSKKKRSFCSLERSGVSCLMNDMFPHLSRWRRSVSELPPDHFIDDTGIALDDFDDLGGDVLIGVVRHGGAIVAATVHLHRGIHRLQQAALADPRENEAGLVERLGTLGACSDADRRERFADAREIAALLRQRATVRYHAERIHLQAVVVMEAQRLVLNHTSVELKTAALQLLSAARVAGVQNGHIIRFRHFVDCGKQTFEVPLGIDVLLAVCRKQNIFALLQPKPGMNVAGLDPGKVVVQHLCHRASGHIGALLGKPALMEITTRVLAVRQIDVRDNVHDAAICFFG